MKKLLAILLFTGFAFSQSSELSQGFGFAAGMQSGVGFSYRNIGENNGFQLTVGAIGRGSGDDDYYFSEERTEKYDYGWTPNVNETYIEQDWNDSYFWGNLGVLYIKPLHRADKSLFYGFGGISTQYTSEKYHERPYMYFLESDNEYTYKPTGSKKELRETELRIFGGIGLGLSYNITKHITLSLELPLTISDDGDIWMIVPQGAIHYFYK